MVMSKRFRTCSLDQPFLLPPSLQDWLPEQHLARFIGDVVSELDLSAITQEYARKDGRGYAAYHPVMLTRLLLYAYCVGKPSSRQIEKSTYDDLAFRYLAADQHPDHDTIANFRQQHLQQLAALFLEALRLCREAGLVKLGHVALDGTKVQAQASFRKNIKGDEMLQREQKLAQRVDQMLKAAERADSDEDNRYGKGRRGDELPADLATAEKRLAKLRETKAKMEEAAREQAAKLAQERERAGGRPRSDAEKKRWQRAKTRSQLTGQKMNLTDGDSQLMKDGATGSIMQSYNAQAVADEQQQIILAADVTKDCNDKTQLVPMTEQLVANVGTAPLILSADCGYWTEDQLAHKILRNIQVLVPPDAEKRGQDKLDEELPANAPRTERAQRMREQMKDPAVAAVYRMRKAIVEPVFAYIKERRGFRRFSLRGLTKVRAEWALICLTHNLLKLHQHRISQANA